MLEQPFSYFPLASSPPFPPQHTDESPSPFLHSDALGMTNPKAPSVCPSRRHSPEQELPEPPKYITEFQFINLNRKNICTTEHYRKEPSKLESFTKAVPCIVGGAVFPTTQTQQAFLCTTVLRPLVFPSGSKVTLVPPVEK